MTGTGYVVCSWRTPQIFDNETFGHLVPQGPLTNTIEVLQEARR
jgi:hypothetical protein